MEGEKEAEENDSAKEEGSHEYGKRSLGLFIHPCVPHDHSILSQEDETRHHEDECHASESTYVFVYRSKIEQRADYSEAGHDAEGECFAYSRIRGIAREPHVE